MLQYELKKKPYTTECIETKGNHLFNAEIRIPEKTMVTLREEHISRPKVLMEFNAYDMHSVAVALRKPGGLVPLDGGSRTAPALVSAPGVRIGAKALMRLEAAMNVMK